MLSIGPRRMARPGNDLLGHDQHEWVEAYLALAHADDDGAPSVRMSNRRSVAFSDRLPGSSTHQNSGPEISRVMKPGLIKLPLFNRRDFAPAVERFGIHVLSPAAALERLGEAS
jgi:hypothetical protein